MKYNPAISNMRAMKLGIGSGFPSAAFEPPRATPRATATHGGARWQGNGFDSAAAHKGVEAALSASTLTGTR